MEKLFPSIKVVETNRERIEEEVIDSIDQLTNNLNTLMARGFSTHIGIKAMDRMVMSHLSSMVRNKLIKSYKVDFVSSTTAYYRVDIHAETGFGWMEWVIGTPKN